MSDTSEESGFQLIGFPTHEAVTELRAREPVEILASQFVEELRAGKSPSVEQYARRFPLHANVIRDSFPVLALLEQARFNDEAASIRRSMPDTFPFTRLGRCELLCELGRGGMGVVFQAREIDTGHVVAVKVLPWRVSIVPDWQKKFEEEARTTAKLRHRNIVPVFRFGQEHGYCYYVMQFVNGIGLDVIIRRLREVDGVIYRDEIERQESAKPRGFVTTDELPAIQTKEDIVNATEPKRSKLSRSSWKSFTQLAIQATQALRYAHSQGILHNDIKPGNLLLDSDGRVWITDFGLSEPIEANDPASRQKVMGTLRYMAPERLMGTHEASSDIYSLGITLYELLTLKTAFEADNEDDMLTQIFERGPLEPRKVEPSIPKGLETIILNCISPHPPQRYPSAGALLSDLLKFSRDQKVVSLRPSGFRNFLSRMTGNQPPRLRDSFDQ
ncbi:serine/threonine protein kinase [Fuerstiella marisgermanici]|uniref:Serine/threonine-protein kinase StkP n=1 Tax=Fuerstiella marisgermanici TaxID=1891926 RepID=A0A1P8WS42_9PLAN|nr:serine/threonine-protein kinase [Fuerstiella marisgermanici]APZ96876.1 Serine/threonine-protein kinase StkP [Fuerstiella marisgermanici]